MKLKTFFIAGIAGTIVNFFLGYLIYGILLSSFMPVEPGSEGKENMTFILLGCATLAFLMAYIFINLAHIINYQQGIKAGAIIGIFTGAYHHFFYLSNGLREFCIKFFMADMIGMAILGAAIGATVAVINRKVK